MTRNTTGPDGTPGSGPGSAPQNRDEANRKAQDDLVDAGSEFSFPASDPPSYMGGAAITGAPPHHGEPPREGVSQELINPDEAQPAGSPATPRNGAPDPSSPRGC